MVHATVEISPGLLEMTYRETIVLKYEDINPNLKMIQRPQEYLKKNGTFFKSRNKFLGNRD